jgi:hypothetical protein
MKKTSILVIAILACFAVACDSDSGQTADNGSGTDVGGTQDTVPVDGAVQTVQFTGQLVDFASKVGMPGVDMLVLDNDTGEPLPGYPAFKSEDQGLISLDLPADVTRVAFKANGKSRDGIWEFKNSYQFNIPSDAKNKRLYAVNKITYTTAPMTAGVVVDITKGIIAGTVYWVNKTSGEEEFVGCVTIEAIPEDDHAAGPQGEVRYFDPDKDLPTPLTKATHTWAGEEGTSRYIVANLPVGQYRIIAKIDGVVVHDEVVLRSYADSICISNIYLEGNANPTPAREECIGKKSGNG